MFETAIIRKHKEGEQSIDAGVIAETLLFYDNVHVLADRGVFADLVRVLGPDNLLRMLDMNAISLTFLRDIPGVQTDTRNGIELHKLVSILLFADKEKKRIHDHDDLALVIESVLGKNPASKKFIKTITPHVEFKRSGEGSPAVPSEPLIQAQSDLKDPGFVKEGIGAVLRNLVPDAPLPHNWSFEIMPIGEDFVVGTNLNLQLLNGIVLATLFFWIACYVAGGQINLSKLVLRSLLNKAFLVSSDTKTSRRPNN